MSSYSKNLCWHCSGIWGGVIPEQQTCASRETLVRSSYRKKKHTSMCCRVHCMKCLFWAVLAIRALCITIPWSQWGLTRHCPLILILPDVYLFFFISKSYFGVSKVSFSFCLKQSEKHGCVMPHGPGKALDLQQHIKQDHLEWSIELMAWTSGRNA